MATGTATVDFGALPGKQDASVAVTGQATIGSGSLVEAWIVPLAGTDHTADEHMVEGLKLFTGSLIAGTGFTIYAMHEHGTSPGRDHFAWGRFNVGWAWV